LRLVKRNGLRLRKLVNSLLDFSRIEAGRVDARYQPTDLAAFTLDLVAEFRSAVEQAGLRLVARCAPLSEPVYVDREMWEKVVLNLLSNAFKFTLEGEIEVILAVEGSEVHLGVFDTGVGIDEHELPNIFDRFHRVTGTRARSQEGTGIGLALVRELVRLHGGTVSVTSRPGKGSSFTVSIPLGSAHLPQDRIQPASSTAATSLDASSFVDDALRAGTANARSTRQAATGRVAAAVHREHILVVDDNADMRSYIERLLLPYWDVTAASDGRQALDAIEQEVPDLVVTDMNMPNLDGRALIQHIRTRRASHALPIIVLSAGAGEDQRVAGLNQGADDYLVKPFSPRELLARVEVQLLRARMRSAADERRNDALLWSEPSPAGSGDRDGVKARSSGNGGAPPPE
jgi:CheY-like chemotaxis protein